METARQAKEILCNGLADLVLTGRAILENPFWSRTAADELGTLVSCPYARYGSVWQRNLPMTPVVPFVETVTSQEGFRSLGHMGRNGLDWPDGDPQGWAAC